MAGERVTSTEQALEIAQRAHPLDLCARLDFIDEQFMKCDPTDARGRLYWIAAWDRTKGHFLATVAEQDPSDERN